MPRPHRSDPSSCLRSRSAAMPIFTYFAVVGSVMIALLFVADATLEKGRRRWSPANTVCQSLGIRWAPATSTVWRSPGVLIRNKSSPPCPHLRLT